MSISVLMSVYKSEKPTNLQHSLKSIWDDQNLKPDEIILVEDGPLSDELHEIIYAWKDRLNHKFKILVNETNLGLTKSLNRGLKVATSKYIARMDSDDISMPDRFKHQAEFLDENPDIMIVGGSLQEFDSINENLNIRRYPLSNDRVLKYIHKASPLAHPTVMMRRSIFENGLCYDERYRTSQDIALWFDVLRAGYKIANLQEVTIKFRRDEDVFRRRSRDKAKNEFKIYLSGIYHLNGLFTTKYIYPIARYIFRMMPVGIIKVIYGSKLRRLFLQRN